MKRAGAVPLALAVALAAVALVELDPTGQLAGFERNTLDARIRHFARPSPATGRVVIVDITEQSLERLRPVYGRWPWPRSAHADLVDHLAADGAAAIGFDLLFADAEAATGLDAARWAELQALAENADLPEVREELSRRLGALRPGGADRAFAEAAARAGRVFQAAVFAPGSGPAPGAPPAVGPTVPIATARPDAVRPHALLPFDELARASRGLGHINATPDADGTYRRFWPLVWSPDGAAAYPSLAVALAAHVRGVPLASLRRTTAGLAVGEVTLPLLDDESAWIHFQGGDREPGEGGTARFRSAYRHLPYELVLASGALLAAGETPPLARGTFRDKVVLVSAQAAGLSDLRATPFSEVTPGIELHANVVDSLLAGRFLRAPREAPLLLLLLAACAAVALTVARARPALGLPLGLAGVLGAVALAWLAYGRGLVLPLVKPAAALTLTFGGVLLGRVVAAERERRWLRGAFGHYLAPAVLEALLRSPERLRLGGERRRLTVLFSDVAGFTSFSERLSPEDVGGLLNAYLDRMVLCVAQTGGTLDKFIGDAVMAEWNAPLDQPDHAARACEAALAMQREVVLHRTEWEAQCGAGFEVRIGVNTGEVVVGNMGSRQVFDYTALGNEVNTAARLEPLNKTFGTRIIVSEATRREAEAQRPGRFAFRRLGLVMPKGRAEPLEIHELVALAEGLDATGHARLDAFERALEEYGARRFSRAAEDFKALLERYGADEPTRLFLASCEALLAKPPPPDWRPVLEQTDK